jgi:hypothetical protein
LSEEPRARRLRRLIPLGPKESADTSAAGRATVIGKLERALRRERNLGRAGHSSYDLGRHKELLAAWREERAAARKLALQGAPTTRGNGQV